MVLAYLMWLEGLPLKTLFQDLKTRKPEIRSVTKSMSTLCLYLVLLAGLPHLQFGLCRIPRPSLPPVFDCL